MKRQYLFHFFVLNQIIFLDESLYQNSHDVEEIFFYVENFKSINSVQKINS